MSERPKDWLWRRRRAIFDRADLPASQKLVLLGVEHHADADGACFPSVATLAGETGLSERTVYRVLVELEARGLLAIDHGGGRRRRNEYLLLLTPAPKGPETPLAEAAAPPEPADETVTPWQETLTPRQGTLTPWQNNPDTMAEELSSERSSELLIELSNRRPTADDFASLDDEGPHDDQPPDEPSEVDEAAVHAWRRRHDEPAAGLVALTPEDFEAQRQRLLAQAAAYQARKGEC